MLTAVVTRSGGSVSVRFAQGLLSAEESEGEEAHGEDAAHAEKPEKDLNPIFPEGKEIAWGFGSFVVFALLMRFFLFPRLKQGMDARYGMIRANVEGADAAKAAAQAEVAEYQAQVAALRTEAAGRVDAARQQLESERAAKLAEVNGRIAERRAAATAEVEAAKAAARDQVASAVSSVSARAAELAIGKTPSSSVVESAVSAVMGAGAAR